MLIELEERELQQLLAILLKVDAPWTVTNPLIVKIDKQMKQISVPQKGNSDEREISARSKTR